MKLDTRRFDLKNKKIEDLFEYYKKYQTPVVVKNVFCDSRIFSIRTAKAFVKEFGEIPVPVTGEYSRALNQAMYGDVNPTFDKVYRARIKRTQSSRQEKVMHVGKYFEYVGKHRKTSLLCAESDLPIEMEKYFRVPERLNFRDPIYNNDFWMALFMGNKGNFAAMHYDWVPAGLNLFYQVFGRKRVVLVSPHETSKMLPIGRSSGYALQNMSGSQQKGFLRYIESSCETILGPGDAILIPPFYWHYIEYIDTGASVNFRFASHRLASWWICNFFADPVMSMYLSNVIDNGKVTAWEKGILRKIDLIASDNQLRPEFRLNQIKQFIDKLAYFRIKKDLKTNIVAFQPDFHELKFQIESIGAKRQRLNLEQDRHWKSAAKIRKTMQMTFELKSNLKEILDRC